MKQRKLFIPVLLGLMLINQSCEKWFDVSPSNEIKAEEQFSSVDGFKDALLGIYIGMGSPNVYGRDMTYNLVDLLSQQYTKLSNTALYFAVQQFDYNYVRSQAQIESLWEKQYNIIANVNSALTHLDNSGVQWNEIEYNIIKGELLGLRAFLHFDLLRLFGRSGYADRGELKSTLTIPYVLHYGKDPTGQLTYEQTFALIEKDLKEASELLKDDPICHKSVRSSSQYSEINRNGFYDGRMQRMNYYAVQALAARVYSWQGGVNLQRAALAAEEVIQYSGAQLLKPNVDVSKDRTIVSEHLFSLNIDKFANIVNPLFEGQDVSGVNSLRISSTAAEELFETDIPTIGLVDVRYNTLLDNQSLAMVSSKLKQINENQIGYQLMPLEKLPEMYYIAAEYYATIDLSKAVSLLEEVRKSRRIVEKLSLSMDRSSFFVELQREYQKEYVSEGQLFFFYKRMGLEHIPNYSSPNVIDDQIYMLPYPQQEIEFGGRVQ
ncbi:RagB/SusD family nutrient uptake outer membrane protein [Sphingobacterium sp. SYP-B4668]|uniref:RagB/SusD family nutrient uptake outer membrane protein n=1 Tax=Sphingobacterium sp. SYP-B4668 TaxID=2996035 RepID=UPI0022DD6EEF|nr:RagB/SusD family nutrient uptake outer membrane protein [Sphingobacterium sp. SYP-B4668]